MKKIIKNLIRKRDKMNLPFMIDFIHAKDKANTIKNELVKKHILEIIENGVTIIPAEANYLNEVNLAVDKFYEFKEKNKDIVKQYENENGYLHRIVNLHEKVDQLNILFENNKTSLEVLDFFLGETICYTSLFFERSSEQDIHRDTPYFWTIPEYQYMGFWIALEDTDENNGSLKVVKGAHKLPEIDRIAIAKQFYNDLENIDPYDMRLWDEYQRQLKEQYTNAGLIEEEVYFKKGDSIIWHPQTPHGGAKILDPKRTRLSWVLHVLSPDVPVYHQDVFFSNKQVSDKASWHYVNIDKRKYIKHGMISFAHQGEYKIKQLK